jgi:uncharacterized protein (TIGR02646 family)
MRRIVKGPEPPSLTQYRPTANSNYEDYQDKDTLRRSLVTEQRGLCCYCLNRIRPQPLRMKIEHWHCQDRYPSEQLVYHNLLGACLGNEGEREQLQHCDTKKANKDLSRNPATPDHQVESFVRFQGDGTVASQDQAFDQELNNVLNLNAPHLRNNRKAALDAFKSTLHKRGELQRATLERWLRDWNGESHVDDLQPFCQVIVYWLRKRLARA